MKSFQLAALRLKFDVPDNHYFFDIGESDNFVGDMAKFLNKGFPDAICRDFMDFCKHHPAVSAVESMNYRAKRIHKESGSEERYSVVIYTPGVGSRDERHWFRRGHEEGHALDFFGLRPFIETFAGRKLAAENKELVADVCGEYALRIRGLQRREEGYRRFCDKKVWLN